MNTVDLEKKARKVTRRLQVVVDFISIEKDHWGFAKWVQFTKLGKLELKSRISTRRETTVPSITDRTKEDGAGLDAWWSRTRPQSLNLNFLKWAGWSTRLEFLKINWLVDLSRLVNRLKIWRKIYWESTGSRLEPTEKFSKTDWLSADSRLKLNFIEFLELKWFG